MKQKVEIPIAKPDVATAKAQVLDAIAHVREAMLLAEEQEMTHFLEATGPCSESHTAADAAVRSALLSSEDAMIQVLQTLPATPRGKGPLVN